MDPERTATVAYLRRTAQHWRNAANAAETRHGERTAAAVAAEVERVAGLVEAGQHRGEPRPPGLPVGKAAPAYDVPPEGW